MAIFLKKLMAPWIIDLFIIDNHFAIIIYWCSRCASLFLFYVYFGISLTMCVRMHHITSKSKCYCTSFHYWFSPESWSSLSSPKIRWMMTNLALESCEEKKTVQLKSFMLFFYFLTHNFWTHSAADQLI